MIWARGRQLGKKRGDLLQAIRARKEIAQSRPASSGAESMAQGGRPADRAFRYDFFISYTSTDRPWAEWIAWQLEEAGYEVMIQAWDFVAGVHFVNQMHQVIQQSARTLAILSPEYLNSAFTNAEWQEAFRSDPQGIARKLVTVRVAPCERPGLLGQVVAFDLFGLDAVTAKQRLLEHVRNAQSGRAKPFIEPRFPGLGKSGEATGFRHGASDAPPFPPERPVM